MELNAFTQQLLERRSIKAYLPEQIPMTELAILLFAAQHAPSSMGEQARHMTVIQDETLLKEIINVTLQKFEDMGKKPLRPHIPFYHAPTVVVFSAPKGSPWAHDDAACAIMNLMHAAHSYGIGTCYIGSALGLEEPNIQARLQLPEGYQPVACVTVGYAAEPPQLSKPRREDDITYIL